MWGGQFLVRLLKRERGWGGKGGKQSQLGGAELGYCVWQANSMFSRAWPPRVSPSGGHNRVCEHHRRMFAFGPGSSPTRPGAEGRRRGDRIPRQKSGGWAGDVERRAPGSAQSFKWCFRVFFHRTHARGASRLIRASPRHAGRPEGKAGHDRGGTNGGIGLQGPERNPKEHNTTPEEHRTSGKRGPGGSGH